MTAMPTLVAVGVPVLAAIGFSVVGFAKERNWQSLAQLVGSAFLLVVLLAHLCETFHLIPQMGWGLANSPGHYLDLCSAIAGVGLFAVGYIASSLIRGKNSN